MRVVMWSGPRNLSTAMMYSFAQRRDCQVVDEPFYAAYLVATGLDHPMRAEILEAQSHDPETVTQSLTTPLHGIRYEKHMSHHVLPEWDLSWLANVVNVFLIRHPARVIASYAAKRENPSADDLGFRQQFALFRHVQKLGQQPIVIDSFDVRADPQGTIAGLCSSIGIASDPAMLRWDAGKKPYDGVWAAHWYDAVHRSTGFAGREGPLPDVAEEHAAVLKATLPAYEAMRAEGC